MRRELFLGGLALLAISPPTWAQTATKPPVSTKVVCTGEECPKIEAGEIKALREDLLSVVAKQKTELKQNQLISIDLEIDEFAPLQEQVPTQGVSAHGYSRYVVVKGKRIGQTVLNKLSKNGKSVSLNPDNFVSQFDIQVGSDKVELDPETVLKVDGNEPELIEALKELEEKQGEEEEEDQEQQDQQEQPRQNSAAGNTGSSGNSGGQSQSPQSQTTAPYEVPTQGNETVTTEIRIVTDGCDLVIDNQSGLVREQSKSQTFENGVMVAESACSESGRTFPIQRSYAACPDTVDIPGRIARPQYTEYFNDADQVRQELSDCQIDEDQGFTITENNSCPVDVDLLKGTAIIQSKLVYINGNNTELQVRECQPSETQDPIDMQRDFSACSIKHDFDAGISKPLATWIYEYDGTFYQASPCIETETIYAHEQIYTQNGVDVCPVIIDMSGQIAVPQYRTAITVDGQTEFIDECRPNENGGLQFMATTETCDNPVLFQHDIGAGVSYGLQRFYYENPNPVYVTECQIGGPTYTHSHELTGWKLDDDQLFGQALKTVSINVNGKNYPIVENALLDGEQQIAYIAEAAQTIGLEDAKSHEGCQVFQQTQIKQNYVRPDDTVLETLVGTGDPLELGDMCLREKSMWVHNDDELYSQGAFVVTVAYDDVVEVIEEGVVEPDEPQIPYEPDGPQTEIELANNKTHDKCNVYQGTELHQNYKRADNSIYLFKQPSPDGKLLGDMCQTEVVDWQHNDEAKFSNPIVTKTVVYDDVNEVVEDSLVDETETSRVAYQALGEVVETPVPDSLRNEHCSVFRTITRAQDFKRVDESVYKDELPDVEEALGDQCVTIAAGWEFNDAGLFGQQRRTLKVQFEELDKVIDENVILPDEPRIAYAKAGPLQHNPTEKYHEKCQVYQGRKTVQDYTRPDGSTYVETSISPDEFLGDMCVTEVVNWLHNDEERYSSPVKTTKVVYDDVNALIEDRVVDDSASARVAYQALGEAVETPVPASTRNQGCEVFRTSRRELAYKRTDGSTYTAQLADKEYSMGQRCVTVATGWDFNDDRLFAQMRKSVSVQFEDFENVLQNNVVLPDEPRVAYAKLGLPREGGVTKFHRGCDVFQGQTLIQTYERPDNSTFERPDGQGMAEPLGDKCVITATGWENNDNELWSKRKRTKTVKYDDVSEIIENNKVLPGEPQVNYTKSGSPIISGIAGTEYHNKCNVYQRATEVQKWKRGDNSIYNQPAQSTTKSLGDMCQSTAVGWKHYDSSQRSKRTYDKKVVYNNVSEWVDFNVPGGSYIDHTKSGAATTTYRDKYHISCNVYQNITIHQNWRRPDSTTYRHDQSSSLSLGDMCVTEVAGWVMDDAKRQGRRLERKTVVYDDVSQIISEEPTGPGQDYDMDLLPDLKIAGTEFCVDGVERAEFENRWEFIRPDGTTYIYIWKIDIQEIGTC